MIDTINKFINENKNKYDAYNVLIYPFIKKEEEFFKIKKKVLKLPVIKQQTYDLYVYRDTYMKNHDNIINIERNRSFIFIDDNKKWLIKIIFINYLKINDMPFITKYHGECKIKKNILYNSNFIISNNEITDCLTNITTKYCVVECNNTLLSNELFTSINNLINNIKQ